MIRELNVNRAIVGRHVSLRTQRTRIAVMVRLCLDVLSSLFRAFQITTSGEERFWLSDNMSCMISKLKLLFD